MLQSVRIDIEKNEVTVVEDGRSAVYPLASPQAFMAVSKAWLRAGWDVKYVYTFSWLGRPVIQLPEDLVRMQEAVYAIQPDVIVETGVAHGGSLVYYAGLCKIIGKGRVIGVDIEIRPHNRRAIEEHPLSGAITLVEGNSVDAAVVKNVASTIRPGEKVMVVLDSNHTKGHVLEELVAYSPLVTQGSYLVAADGIMKDLAGAPRAAADWDVNNPLAAVEEFLAGHPEFVSEPPRWPFNESDGLSENVTYWPGAWLKRVGD